MRKLLLTLAAFASLTFAQTQTFTYSYSGLPLPVFPDDWNVWSILPVFVPKSIAVTNVTASVTVQYSGVGDLNVFLWSPAGTRTKLLERNCGSLQNINTTFDDSAPSMFHDVCPSTAGGSYRGNEPLGNSRNENGFGYWRLGVENNGSSRTGTLTGFTVTITGTVLGPPAIGPNTILSTAAFETGAIAPGDQITLLGVNLGPTAGVRADATKPLPTSLGQTTVTFDGVAAPLYYVSDGVVQVQSPVTLTPRASTRIQVTASAGSSLAIPVAVFSTNPGIFTYDATGHGQAKAVNQDGTLNGDGTNTGSDVPAPAGSVIQVYAAGLGAVDPQVPQGTPAPASPLSLVTGRVTAAIAGVPADVSFAGLAPGMIGVYQVNITVPAKLPSGPARLTIYVDGIASQNAVTVQLR